MKVGIVGLPNAGKSTVFNALTRAGAETAEYPFTTLDPNVAVVEVPDGRLDAVAETVGAAPLVRETIEFHDIAGLVRRASEGEGLGNQFLANIRETDAILHVARTHSDEQVPHPAGRLNLNVDLETVEAELLLADVDQAVARLDRVTREAHGGRGKEVEAERAWLEQVVAMLATSQPARTVPVPDGAPEAPQRLQALTSKPMLYVANVDEGTTEIPAEVVERAARTGSVAVALSAKIEAELADLEADEAAAMRAELGISEPGLERLVRAAYDALDLITFFTAHEGAEARARSLRRSGTAWDAAGRVHTDMQEGFVRAEVIGWQDLVEADGYAAARERAKLRTEGRDYVVQDGDVITIRH